MVEIQFNLQDVYLQGSDSSITKMQEILSEL